MVRPGVFRARVYIGTVDGRERTRSLTFEASNMREARKEATKYERQIRDGVALAQQSRGTVAELVKAWAEHRNQSPTTGYRESSITKRIASELGHLQARDLTARDVEGFYARLRRVVVARAIEPTETHPGRPERLMSESTVHHYHRVLRAILRYGKRHGYVDKVVTEDAVKPAPVRFEVVIHHDDVMERLFATAPASIQLAVGLDAMTGLRRGELFGLRWRDIRQGIVHVVNNTVTVPGQVIDKTTKGKRSRRVPLVEPAQRALALLRAEQEAEAERQGVKLHSDARVLADTAEDPTGRTPLHPDWLSGAWRRHCAKAGVHVRLHDLRHWYASWLLNNGVPITVVQEVLGHADSATTHKVYAHTVHGALDVAREAIARKASVALPG